MVKVFQETTPAIKTYVHWFNQVGNSRENRMKTEYRQISGWVTSEVVTCVQTKVKKIRNFVG